MRALLLKSLTILVLGYSPIPFFQTRSLEHAGTLALSRVSPAAMTVAEKNALKASQRALHNLTNIYNYESKSPWTFEVLRCPLITKHVVMEFTSVEVSEGSSKYVAVLPYRDGRVHLIPLWYRGLRPFEKPYHDPHNIAVFNQTMEIEARQPNSDVEWLKLAVCYLTMVGESPDVLLGSTIREHFGDVSPETLKRILPVVTTTKSYIEVSFFDTGGKATVSKWDLTFDRAGLLRDISRETHEKSELLKPS